MESRIVGSVDEKKDTKRSQKRSALCCVKNINFENNLFFCKHFISAFCCWKLQSCARTATFGHSLHLMLGLHKHFANKSSSASSASSASSESLLKFRFAWAGEHDYTKTPPCGQWTLIEQHGQIEMSVNTTKRRQAKSFCGLFLVADEHSSGVCLPRSSSSAATAQWCSKLCFESKSMKPSKLFLHLSWILFVFHWEQSWTLSKPHVCHRCQTSSVEKIEVCASVGWQFTQQPPNVEVDPEL